MIQIENLHFAHPGRSELYGGLNFKLRKEENILLQGSNGCGKSTLLKLIVGLLRPHQGTITVAGKPVNGISSALFRSILYQGQNTADNLLGINSRHDWEIWQLSVPALPGLPAEDTLLFSEMSAGMQKQCSQRILPYMMDKYWILDEPFTSLDASAARELATLLLQKSKNHPGMLIVSHEQSFTEGVFNRILKLQQGRICENTR